MLIVVSVSPAAARGLGSTLNLPSSASLAHRAVAARDGASKMEAIASSAVRAADNVGASLIVVYTQSGSTASMVARYRPPMPILTLVVPQVSDGQRLTRLSLHVYITGARDGSHPARDANSQLHLCAQRS